MSPFVPIFASFLGGMIALLGIYLKGWVDRRELEDRVAKIVWKEFDDIARHYDRNVARILTIKYFVAECSMWPDVNHIEKLRWPEDTYIFTEESLKYSSVKTIENIYKMRLRLRNANLDVGVALRGFATEDPDLFLQSLDFVEQRHLRIEDIARDFTKKPRQITFQSDEQKRAGFAATKDMLFFDKQRLAKRPAV